MRQPCVHRDMKHLGSLESAQEARVALDRLRLEQLLRIFRSLQISCVPHISMNAQLTHEPIVNLQWHSTDLRDVCFL